MYEKRPCRGCRVRCYPDMECPVWEGWFLEAWDDIQRSAWQILEEESQAQMGKQVFRYMLPHEYQQYLRRGPCPGCLCEPWCDRPCSRYLAWWDARMAYARKEAGKKEE